MIKYAQIEAIHEAMRECEGEREVVDIPTWINAVGGMQATIYHKVDVDRCFAKIRAALAGEVKEGE